MDVKRKQSLYQDTLLTSPRTRTHRNPNLHDETLPLVPLNGRAHTNGHAVRGDPPACPAAKMSNATATPAANGNGAASNGNGTGNGHQANHSSDAPDAPMLASAAETPSRTRDGRRSSADSSGYSSRTRCLLWLSAAGAAWIIVTALAVVLYVQVRGRGFANSTSVEVSFDGSRQLTVQVTSGAGGGGLQLVGGNPSSGGGGIRSAGAPRVWPLFPVSGLL